MCNIIQQIALILVTLISLWISRQSIEAATLVDRFAAVDHGLTVEGDTVKDVGVRTVIECAFTCSLESSCVYYEYREQVEPHCVIIQRNTNEGETFVASEENLIYQRDCRETWSLNWTAVDEPVYYHGFEDLRCLTATGALVNGVQQVPGVIGEYAIRTDSASLAWVDFGSTVSKACITSPETCTNGGALTVWVKVLDWTQVNAVMCSFIEDHTGFYIHTAINDNELIVTLHVPTGYFRINVPYSTALSGWFHLALTYIGPGSDEGIQLRINSNTDYDNFTYGTKTNAAGFQGFAIGRFLHNNGVRYGNVEVDELSFWNRILSQQEVQELYDQYNQV